jgi:23S rRNA (uracil1939-C5)-methyltransferase
MTIAKGQEVELEIEQFADRGKSIARVDGYVVFVPHGVPGDRVRVAITRRRKKFAEGRIVEIVRPSDNRAEPACKYFGTCGGCKWQNLDYETQLDAKHESVFAAFRHHGGFKDVTIPPVIGSPDTYRYRNKMEFSFSASRWLTGWEIASGEPLDKTFALGLHVPGRFDKVLDINSCDLVPGPVMEIVNAIRDLALLRGWKPWHIRRHEGYLRHLVVRLGHHTGEILLDLVTSSSIDERNRELAEMVAARFPAVTTLANTVHSGPAQTSIGQSTQILAGPGVIKERLGRFTFEIGPKTFFQTNTAQAEKLFEIALDFAAIRSDETVYDLYCGCGTISLLAADQARRVIGVELIPEAVEAARRNAEANGVTNCEFVVGDMLKTFNNEFVEANGMPDVVIVDPPRAGLHPKVVRRLARLGADRIVYVSCNPLSQVRDLVELSPYYEIRRIQPVDLFPQTHHVENVVLLKRREET